MEAVSGTKPHTQNFSFVKTPGKLSKNSDTKLLTFVTQQ